MKTYFGYFLRDSLRQVLLNTILNFFIPAYLQLFRCKHLFSVRLENSVHPDPITKKEKNNEKNPNKNKIYMLDGIIAIPTFFSAPGKIKVLLEMWHDRKMVLPFIRQCLSCEL